MKLQFLPNLAALIMVSLIFGCSTSDPRVYTVRNYPTVSASTPRVTVLLSYYGECEQFWNTTCGEEHSTSVWEKDITFDREEDLATCVVEGIRNVIPAIVYLPPQEGRLRLLGSRYLAPPPVEVNTVLPLLKTDKLSDQSLDYVVLIRMATKSFNKKTTFISNSIPFLWGISREWDKETFSSADIIDVAGSQLAGTVTSIAYGHPGWFVPVVIIIPLIPIPIFASTESKACMALGEAVGHFLNGKDPLSM